MPQIARIAFLSSITFHIVHTPLIGVQSPITVKVKEYRNRPGVAQRVPRSLGSQISMTFGE
jgi:hypothetical protein